MEGYSINVNAKITELDVENIRSIIVPGGDVSSIKNDEVYKLLRSINENGKLVAGICAGVDVLDEAGVLFGVRSTHSEDLDIVREKNIITARANAYVDFALEVAKELKLFKDENDLQETIDFWKFHKKM